MGPLKCTDMFFSFIELSTNHSKKKEEATIQKTEGVLLESNNN